MRLTVIALLATACHQAERAPARVEAHSAQPGLRKYVEPLNRPGFSGRVFHGSAPVTYFGVAVVSDLRLLPPTRIDEVRSTDGYFHIPYEPGTWDVVIVAPGFGRKLLHRKTIEELRSTDLGIIQLAPSFVTRGHVRDLAGQPVAGAVVTITDSVLGPNDGSLAAIAAGNFRTTTDASGHFAVRGATSIDGSPLRMVAEHGKLRSYAVGVTAGNDTIDLVVLPTGTVEGFTPHVADGARAVMWSQTAREIHALQIRDHRFTIDVPVGSYMLRAPGPNGQRSTKQVTVVPDATTTVTFP